MSRRPRSSTRSGKPVPRVDGFHAAAARQERTRLAPLSGLHAGPESRPAADLRHHTNEPGCEHESRRSADYDEQRLRPGLLPRPRYLAPLAPTQEGQIGQRGQLVRAPRLLGEGAVGEGRDLPSLLGEGQGVRARPLARRTMDLFEIPGHRGSLRSAGVGNSIDGNSGRRRDHRRPLRQAGGRRQPCHAAAGLGLVRERSLHAALGRRLDRAHAHALASRRPGGPAAEEDGRPFGRPLGRPLPAGGPRGGPCRRLRPPPWRGAVAAVQIGRDLEIIRQQDARAYAALYQQNPTDALAAEWAPEFFGDWIWVPPEKWPEQFDLKVVCVDASKGRSDKQGDYSAIVFLGVPADGLLYVDAIVERIPLVRSSARRWFSVTSGSPISWASRRSSSRSCWSTSSAGSAASSLPRAPAVVPDDDAGRAEDRADLAADQYVINRELRFRADSLRPLPLVDQLMDFPLAEHDDGHVRWKCVRVRRWKWPACGRP